jgi:ABC-type methionine transport system permease subunit
VQTGSSLLLREKTIPIIVLVGVSAVTALLAMGGLALLILRKGQWKSQYFRLVIEGVAVVVIVEAVLVLAMSEGIESNGAVSILSGIAGYVLGRTIAEEGSSKKD